MQIRKEFLKLKKRPRSAAGLLLKMAAVSYPLADHCWDSIFPTFLPIHDIFLYSNFCCSDVCKVAFFLMRGKKHRALVAPLQSGCCQPTGVLLGLLERNCHTHSLCSWGVLCPGIILGWGSGGASFTACCLCMSLYSPLLILSPFPFRAWASSALFGARIRST